MVCFAPAVPLKIRAPPQSKSKGRVSDHVTHLSVFPFFLLSSFVNCLALRSNCCCCSSHSGMKKGLHNFIHIIHYVYDIYYTIYFFLFLCSMSVFASFLYFFVQANNSISFRFCHAFCSILLDQAFLTGNQNRDETDYL